MLSGSKTPSVSTKLMFGLASCCRRNSDQADMSIAALLVPSQLRVSGWHTLKTGFTQSIFRDGICSKFDLLFNTQKDTQRGVFIDVYMCPLAFLHVFSSICHYFWLHICLFVYTDWKLTCIKQMGRAAGSLCSKWENRQCPPACAERTRC